MFIEKEIFHPQILGTETTQPPKQLPRSPRWYMADKWHTYLFVKQKVFSLYQPSWPIQSLSRNVRLCVVGVSVPLLRFFKRLITPIDKG